MVTPPPKELRLMLLRSQYQNTKSARKREILTMKANRLKKGMNLR